MAHHDFVTDQGIKQLTDVERSNAEWFNEFVEEVHFDNEWWWVDLETGKRLNRNVGEMLMLAVSELAEALEGHRKNLMDTHLPNRKMIEVELADTVIRVMDLAGGLKLDLGGAIMEKLAYNQCREDHKVEARLAENGKRY